MQNVIFLDIDGVLNTRKSCVSTPSGNVGIDEARLAILANAMKETGADGVILTTTWKNLRADNDDYIYLVKSLDKYGIKVLGKTEEVRAFQREEGILQYLELHPEISEFVILDDQHFGYKDYTKIWEGFIDTKGLGIEHGRAASQTPSVSVILFEDAIKKYEK